MVIPMSESALDMPDPALNGRRAGGDHQAGDTSRPAPPASKAEGSAAQARAAADVTPPGTRLRKGRTRRLTREQVQDITRLYFDEGLKMRELVERTGLPQAAVAPVIGLERKRRAQAAEGAQEAAGGVDFLSLRHVSPGVGADGGVSSPRHVSPERAAVEGARPSFAEALELLQSPQVRRYRALPADVRGAVETLLGLEAG